MSKPTKDEIKNNIQAQDAKVWSRAQNRPPDLDIFESDLAKAIAEVWADVVDAFVISSVPVVGGTSAPNGPLQNGVAALSPGTLTNNVSFTVIREKFSTSFSGSATEGLKALIEAISLGIGESFAQWLMGYSITLVASGGTCAWVSGTTPAPGPWTRGIIEPSPLSDGTSTGDSAITAANLLVSIDNEVDPATLKQNQNQLQPALRDFIDAVVKGFETTWNQWKLRTKISGGTGTGTASPPNGAVVGTVSKPIVA